MDFKNLLYRIEQGIAVISFNRPKALNAMTLELMEELGQAFDAAAADAAVRAIVLTGEGRGFSTGADLAATSDKPPLDLQGRLDLGFVLDRYYNPLILKMRELPKPIISAVNGIAAGAGANLALMADLTVAARSASFLQAFVNVGLIPDAGGTWILPRAIGPQRAMGLALMGEKLSAEQAKEWGLIWSVVDDEQLMPTVLAMAKRLAEGPAVAIERIKRAIHAAAANELDKQLDLESDLQRDCGQSQDFMEGAMAFVQKRKPNFKGR
ncbi:2-(1,2-epoxy-1,2-dihydrophenyl)acetyl-CoA isomerase [Solimonas fluminis]|uniref:2-(1,2-epoxy-1,2-dihydrophenyl)acetyl-CoA isomerase n=1 Tax=Solimonas fluminis TaxID=2086571 RepID=A0A2S5THT6_9GAMM|nr:enoyl-CoA hydratase-related protein [Solimonas fluminis]PPE74507.1 2-(1,2-epoxy-1,2-dihydrophenyl)acetyl-CoA isomerase [Solimonas fluminis]